MSNSNGFRVTPLPMQYALGFVPMLCWILENNRFIGTGFLVGPDLIMTNCHVYQDINKQGHTNCKVFFFNDDQSSLDPPGFHNNENEWAWIVRPPRLGEQNDPVESESLGLSYEQQLDYAILRLDREVGYDHVKIFDDGIHVPLIGVRGWVRLFGSPNDVDKVVKRENIVVIHHPASAQAPEYSFTQIDGFNKERTRLYYKFTISNVGTDGGSSGALCIGAQSGKLVALHQAHHGESLYREEIKRGIPISKIVYDLENALSEERKKRLSQERDTHRWTKDTSQTSIEFSQRLADVIRVSSDLVTTEYLVLAYLGSLPEHNIPRHEFDLIIATQDLLSFPGSIESCPILDFIMFVKDKDLSEIKTGLDNCVSQLAALYPGLNIEKAIESSKLRVSKRRQENKFVRVQIDIRSDINNINNSNNRLFDAQIFISIMGKAMQISDNLEFRNIKSRRDFVNRLEKFWYSKADNYLRELGPSVVEIAFRVTNDTLDWEVDRQELRNMSYGGRYYIVIGDKYPVWYSSIDRQDRIFSARTDLEKAWRLLDKEGTVFKVKRRDLYSNTLSRRLAQLPNDASTVCVFSVVSLEQAHKLKIYDYILMKGIPAFIWRRNNIDRLPKKIVDTFSNITSVSDLRKYISSRDGNPLEHSKYVAFLFDDPGSAVT